MRHKSVIKSLFLFVFIALFITIKFACSDDDAGSSSSSGSWIKIIGGSGSDLGNSVACDLWGNIYITGTFQDTVDFDSGPGTDEQTSYSGYDIFITKVNRNGSYGWTKTMGGIDTDVAHGIACDQEGNVYVTGQFGGTVDFDPGTGSDDLSSTGLSDIFVTKFNSDGSYGWTKTMGGSGSDEGHGIACDSSGNVYVVGEFAGTADFDPDPGVDNLTSAGLSDIFIVKFDSYGFYEGAKRIGASGSDTGIAIACDLSGNTFATGTIGEYEIYIVKIDSLFNVIWEEEIGGIGTDVGYGITTDSSGNFFVAGYFGNTVDFDPDIGMDNKTVAGQSDIFVTKFNSDCSYAWTQTMGGTNTDAGLKVACDSSGNVFITGYFTGTADFDPGITEEDNKTAVGSEDIFITKLNSDGSYGWTKTMGGNSTDQGFGINCDTSGNVFITGNFQETVDFDAGTGTDNRTSKGYTDIFIIKLDQ